MVKPFVALLLLAPAWLRSQEIIGIPIGQTPPAVTLQNLNGDSVSLSQWRSADDGMRFRLKLAQVSKNDRYPGFKPHQQKFVEEGCSRHPVDRSDRILVDAEGRREQAHVHRDGGRSVEVNQQI